MNHKLHVFIATLAIGILIPMMTGCDLDTRESLNLAKTTFEGTLKGDLAIAKNFDWREFRLQGSDFGPSYMTLTTEYEKGQFQKAIIMRMASFYKARNWTTANVRNWKVDSKGVESAIVSAQVQGGGKIIMYMQKVNYEKKINRVDFE